MKGSNQGGFIQVIALVLVFVGVVTGAFLSTHSTVFKPIANTNSSSNLNAGQSQAGNLASNSPQAQVTNTTTATSQSTPQTSQGSNQSNGNFISSALNTITDNFSKLTNNSSGESSNLNSNSNTSINTNSNQGSSVSPSPALNNNPSARPNVIKPTLSQDISSQHSSNSGVNLISSAVSAVVGGIQNLASSRSTAASTRVYNPAFGLAGGYFRDKDIYNIHALWYSTFETYPSGGISNNEESALAPEFRLGGHFDPSKVPSKVSDTLQKIGTGKWWRIGNEINLTGGDSDGQLGSAVTVDQFDISYNEIKKQDPTAKIVAPSVFTWNMSPSGNFVGFLSAYKTKHSGANLPVDAFDIHLYDYDYSGPYTQYSASNTSHLIDNLNNFRIWLNGQGYSDKAIWVSEFPMLSCFEVKSSHSCFRGSNPFLSDSNSGKAYIMLRDIIQYFINNQTRLNIQKWSPFYSGHLDPFADSDPYTDDLCWQVNTTYGTTITYCWVMPIQLFASTSPGADGYLPLTSYGQLYSSLAAQGEDSPTPSKPALYLPPDCGTSGSYNPTVYWHGMPGSMDSSGKESYRVEVSSDDFKTFYSKIIYFEKSTDLTGFTSNRGDSLALRKNVSYKVRVFNSNYSAPSDPFTPPCGISAPIASFNNTPTPQVVGSGTPVYQAGSFDASFSTPDGFTGGSMFIVKKDPTDPNKLVSNWDSECSAGGGTPTTTSTGTYCFINDTINVAQGATSGMYHSKTWIPKSSGTYLVGIDVASGPGGGSRCTTQIPGAQTTINCGLNDSITLNVTASAVNITGSVTVVSGADITPSGIARSTVGSPIVFKGDLENSYGIKGTSLYIVKLSVSDTPVKLVKDWKADCESGGGIGVNVDPVDGVTKIPTYCFPKTENHTAVSDTHWTIDPISPWIPTSPGTYLIGIDNVGKYFTEGKPPMFPDERCSSDRSAWGEPKLYQSCGAADHLILIVSNQGSSPSPSPSGCSKDSDCASKGSGYHCQLAGVGGLTSGACLPPGISINVTPLTLASPSPISPSIDSIISNYGQSFQGHVINSLDFAKIYSNLK